MPPPPVESRHLRYVIAVSEEENITRAAQTRLYISAPSLAREIRNLEERLGYKIFERRWRGVTLTPAGRAFVEEGRKALAHIQRAADRGAAASRAAAGMMAIGFCPLVDSGRLIETRKRLRELEPALSPVFRSAESSLQQEMVLGAKLNAGLVLLPVEDGDLGSQCVWRDRLSVALPENSALASSPIVSLHDLSGQPTVLTMNPRLRHRILESCRASGCLLTIAHEVTTADELIDAVGAGLGVGFVKSTTSERLQAQGVVFRELAAPGLNLETGVIYRSDDLSTSLRALLLVLNEIGNCGQSVDRES